MHPREAANDPELELTFSAPPPSPPVSPGPVVGDGLFPYAGGYHAWAGTCLDNDPEGQIPGDGGPYYPAGQRETPVLTTPGQTTEADVKMKSVDVQVRQAGVAVPSVTVVGIHAADESCTSGITLQLGVTDALGNLKTAMPYGLWTFQVTGRSPSGSWPAPVLDPTTADPQTVPVNVI